MMKCFVLILSLLLSLFSGGKPDNVSGVSSAESRYSVSERSSSENAVDHTINRDICITAAQGYSFTGNNSTNSVSVRTTNTGHRLSGCNAFRHIEVLPKSHCLLVLSVLTNILRIHDGITARSCSIVSGSGWRRMMSCMWIKSSSEKLSSPIDFSA